ncbi:MAG: hypothetical protein KG012_19255 [Deltaproteobacteria bacterium]|nr:hypothetical protein [Deltaproteobacteria bacterium]
MAEIQIEGLASRDEEFLSRKDLEKDLEEVSGDKKREKIVIVYLLTKSIMGTRPRLLFYN